MCLKAEVLSTDLSVGSFNISVDCRKADVIFLYDGRVQTVEIQQQNIFVIEA